MSEKIKAILDFDDLMDGNDPLDVLEILKDRDPNFKVTLFAIPTRCSEFLLEKYKTRSDWIELGIHGWRHSRHECLAWTSEETVEKLHLARAIYPGFAPVFKAPNWEMCDEVYQGLMTEKVIVADHIRNLEICPQQAPQYVYNRRVRHDPYQRIHGHIQNWNGTGLTEKANGHGVNPAYVLPIGTRYGFVTEAASNWQAVAV